MTQPVAWDGVTVSKGAYKAAYDATLTALRHDFKFRVFVAPPQSGVIHRTSVFNLGQPVPGEVVSSDIVLASPLYIGDTTLDVNRPIPAYYPQSGQGFIGYQGQYRVFTWSSHTGDTFSGVNWNGFTDGRTLFPAGSVVSLWADVTDYVAGENALQFTAQAERQIVSWTGQISGVNYNRALFAKDNYILTAKATSLDPVGGVWGAEGVFRLGFIRSLTGAQRDASKAGGFSIRISGLADKMKTIQTSPISVANKDVAEGTPPAVSSTVINVETLQVEAKGDWVGIAPSVTPENITDGDSQTFWVSEGTPYENFFSPGTFDVGLMIDEVYVNPDVGLDDGYKWVALFNPKPKATSADGWQLVISATDLQWANWLDRAQDGDPANDDDPSATGTLGPYQPPGTPGIEPWVSYPSKAYYVPGGVEVPAYSRIIICRDMSKFLDVFDPGDAQVFEDPYFNPPSSDAIIKLMWIVSGVGPGINAGDTIVYGTPTYYMPYYWTDNCSNPSPGFSLRRRYPGDISRGHNIGTNFVQDANPAPGDLRDRARREWVHIDLKENALGLYLDGSLGTGPVSLIRFRDAGGDPASTYKLDKSGSIKFQGYTEVIQYADNDGTQLTGITRGVTPEAIASNATVAQMVGEQATYDVSTSAITIRTKASGPVFGNVQIWASKTGSATIDLPSVIAPETGTNGDSAWRNDFDMIWSGDVYDHFLRKDFAPRRSRHYLVVINSMPIRCDIVSDVTGALSGDILVSSPTASILGGGAFMRHGGIQYDYDSIQSLGENLYRIVNVQPKGGTEGVRADKHLFVGQNRARMSDLQIMQSNLVGASGLMVGDGDTDVLMKYLIQKTTGLPDSRVLHIDKPARVPRLTTSKGSLSGVLADICRRHGLIMVEHGDMTIEFFGDTHMPVRNGYREAVCSFGDHNSVVLNKVDTNPEDVSQVEVRVVDPETGVSSTATYPGRPYPTGAVYRENDLIGDTASYTAFLIAMGIFRKLRQGERIEIIPGGPIDWIYPPMRVSVAHKDRNTDAAWYNDFIVESVSTSYSLVHPKGMGITVGVVRL